jgi:hypothetical protein
MLLVDVVCWLVKKCQFTCISSGTHLLTSYKAQTLYLSLYTKELLSFPSRTVGSLLCCRILQVDSHIACRAAKGLECVFPIWFIQCGRVWFTLAVPRPCPALTMPFFSRPRHSTAVERRPVGYLPAFGFFRLPRRVLRRLLSEAYQSSSQRSIPTAVKCGISMLQKRRSVKLLE